MGVNSYAEIFTTVIGWHLFNVVWDVLVSTGIVYLPFLGMLYEHWRTAFVDGEEAGGAGAGLRALEIDLFIGLMVMLLACMPSSLTALNRASVFYAPPATTANPSPVTATGATPDSTFGTTLAATPGTVNVPVWWYSVMAVSAGVNTAIISGSGLTLDDLRKVVEASRLASLDDPHVRSDVQRFYNECYVPARTKYFGVPPTNTTAALLNTYGADDPEWMGSHVLREDPSLYPVMYAEREVPGWPFDGGRDRDQAGGPVTPTWGRPSCKEWWEGGAIPGLRQQIVDAAGATSKLNSLVATFGASLTAERRADLVARQVLDKTRLTVIPDAYVPANTNFVKETASSSAVMIGGFITTFFTWLSVSVMKPSLPFIQCLLLLGIYMLLPLVMVISRYSLVTMIQAALAIFTVKMWSVLWFVADFLDDKLALAIYPDADSALSAMTSFFKIGDSTKAMLLNLVVMAMYLALPALWSGLMMMVGVRIGAALSSPMAYAAEPIRAAGTSAGSIAGRAIALGARSLAKASRSMTSRGSARGPQRP